jgi:hypothetical protein
MNYSRRPQLEPTAKLPSIATRFFQDAINIIELSNADIV